MLQEARPYKSRRHSPHPAVLSAKVEQIYIAVVSFALGVAGTALGFSFGVVPYFRDTFEITKYNGFFLLSVAVGAFLGFVVGLLNGARWYRATEATPASQRRMLAYIKRRGIDERGVPQRTIGAITLRSLLGQRRSPKA